MNVYEKTVLHISHIEEHTDLLGPGRRFVLWVHGCCFDCEGCLAQNTRFGPYETIGIDKLSDRIDASGCEGITVSGGEPFLQAAALKQLIHAVRARRDIGVIVYSGFTLAEIQADDALSPLLGDIDILIDGRYVKKLDDGRPYVGSSNQVIHYLTPRYIKAGRNYYSSGKRRAEIKLTPTQAILIGVPSPAALHVWQEIKQKGGGTHDF